MRHFNFTDDAVLYFAPPLRDLLALGSIDGARGLAIRNAYVATFLDRALLHGPSAAQLSPPGTYPEARAVCGPR